MRRNKTDLSEMFPDHSWRLRLLEIARLVELLEESILAPDYQISDALNSAVTLSDEGKRIQKILITKHQVPPKEARLLCFLTIAHGELLVDVEALDLEKVRAAIEAQLLDGDLLHPFIFGRELYDKASSLFEEERAALNFQESTRLLKDTSPGVFQVGKYVTGPYGLIESSVDRDLTPTTTFPLYHCAEVTCRSVHVCNLKSDSSASINEHRATIHRVLEKEHGDSWAWSGFLGDIAGLKVAAFNDMSTWSLPFLLGDALTDSELRTLLGHLMDETHGELRDRLTPLGVTGSSRDATTGLTRAQLLQLILLAANAQICAALDALVLDGDIPIIGDEVRRPVVHRTISYGRWDLQVQLGRFGIRTHSLGHEIGPLRLKRLVDGLYRLDEQADITELEWQLREVEGATLLSRLEEYLRTFTPSEVVSRLVMARRTNMIAACTTLGIDEHRNWSDEDLVSAILWKLDFQPNETQDPAARFWQLHERMKQMTQTAGVSAMFDSEAVRALASNYFVLLEKFLLDSVGFSTWALTQDHLSQSTPFAFRPSIDIDESLVKLNEFEAGRESGPEVIVYGANASLYELCRSFGSLSLLLAKCESDSDKFKRDSDSFPTFTSLTDLKEFPFSHTVPFLDLLPSSRELILGTLTEATRLLVSADVSGVRNDQLHFRRSTADLGRLTACLQAVEVAASNLERSGLTRIQFRPVQDRGDEWGRRIFTLSDARGREIAIARPTKFDWLRLPGPAMRQYLCTAALFAEPNEMLRFTLNVESPYAEMWKDYPVRRAAASRVDSSVGRVESMLPAQN